MGALNWTQLHKSVWDGPASKAMGHAPRFARDWPVLLSYHRPGRRRTGRQLRTQALVAHADFLKVGHFAPFSQFLRIKGRNFLDVFYPFMSTYDPYVPWNVSWKSVLILLTFLRNPEDRHTHTDRQTLQLYVTVLTCIVCCLVPHLPSPAMCWMVLATIFLLISQLLNAR